MLTEQEIWLKAWLATAEGLGESRNLELPTVVADKCLADFKQRFKSLKDKPVGPKNSYFRDGFSRFKLLGAELKDSDNYS